MRAKLGASKDEKSTKINVFGSHFAQEIVISAFDSSKNRGGPVDHFDIHIMGAAVF